MSVWQQLLHVALVYEDGEVIEVHRVVLVDISTKIYGHINNIPIRLFALLISSPPRGSHVPVAMFLIFKGV